MKDHGVRLDTNSTPSTSESFKEWMASIIDARLHATPLLVPLVFKSHAQKLNAIRTQSHIVPTWEDLERRKDPLFSCTTAIFSSSPDPDVRSVAAADGGHGVGLGVKAGGVTPQGKGGRNQASGKPFTSRFRGVHRTIPTRRWEAQFRKDGKPTSLGCFDTEESAARAYDKMMLWCGLHQRSVGKPSVTNFPTEDYEDDIVWLKEIGQDALLLQLRKEGRAEAAMRQDREGKATRASRRKSVVSTMTSSL
jgi:hypothetical protein